MVGVSIAHLNDFLDRIWFLFHNGLDVIVMVMVVMVLYFDLLLGLVVARLGDVVVVVALLVTIDVDHFLHFGAFGGRVLLVLGIDEADVLVRLGDGVLRTTVVALRVSGLHRVHVDLAHFSVALFHDVEARPPRGRLLVRAIDVVAIGLGRTESHGRRYRNRCEHYQTKSLNKQEYGQHQHI